MLEDYRNQQAFFGSTIIDEEYKQIKILSATNIMDISSNNFDNPFSTMILEDREDKIVEDFESVWNGYLNMINLFQFKENSLFMTTKGIENNLYSDFFAEEDVMDEINTLAETNEFWKDNMNLLRS